MKYLKTFEELSYSLCKDKKKYYYKQTLIYIKDEIFEDI